MKAFLNVYDTFFDAAKVQKNRKLLFLQSIFGFLKYNL